MPADLELFLALLVGIITRDQVGTRSALRTVAVSHDEADGYRLIQALSNSLRDDERFWFRNLLGPRPEPKAPEPEAIEAGNTEPEPVCP